MRGTIHTFFGLLCMLPCLSLKLDVFSTKTTYQWAHNTTVTTPVVEDAESSFSYGNGKCHAIQVYAVVRHGTRYPSDGTMEDMPGLFNKIRDNKDAAMFTGFDSWTNRYEMEKESQLVQEGINELIMMGGRFARRFYRLFQMRGNHVKFASSYKTRASNSSKYFHQGMMDETSNLAMYMNEINNTLARFYDDCYNFENGVEDNDTHMVEFHKYGNSSEFMAVTDALLSRLGLNATLSQDDVYLIYEMCAYELYMFGENLWCGLLNDTDREILEYGQDLEKYYENGDTSPIITKMTCPLVHDILHTMNSSKSDMWDYMSSDTNFTNTGYLAGKFVFGHSETVTPLMTAFDLYKDSIPLLASNRVAMQNRLFRTSHIVPYAANVAIVTYVCNDTSRSQMNRSFVVKMYVNEQPVVIPACNNMVCGFDEFVAYYSPITDNCNLTQICGIEEDGSEDDTSGVKKLVPTFLLFLVFPLLTVLGIQ